MVVVNIGDVAADAGVSRSTVSYVLSGTRTISPETRERVRASIRKLGYRPNPAARALTLKRTGILGLLADVGVEGAEADVETFMQFVQEALFTARRRGYDLIVMGNGEEELRGDVLADALVMMDIAPDERRLDALADIGVPATLIGVPDERQGFFAVDLDFGAAGTALAGHLVHLGHDVIAYLAPEPDAVVSGFTFMQRFERGLEDRARALGVQVTAVAQPGDLDIAGWWATARSESPDLTAVITPGPAALDDLYPFLTGSGVSVPGDLSVVTLATERRLRRAPVPTTGVTLPVKDMVGTAVDRAVDALEGAPADGALLLAPAILDLGSTARRR